ncbi:MAG: hypothetical protein ACD_20C00429G0021 [uncultured bacterium]|nr:MAG: hypothetical protein ACD_20C00429G0021 [uncultured bacterium]
MSFSMEWDEKYKENTHMSIWPWSDVVSYVMRYAKPQNSDIRVLELGCGAGANIPFFKKLGVKYYAIEGSLTIVEKLKKQYPEYSENIVVGDFTKEIPFEGDFDIILDRAALTCNSTNSIIQTLSLISNKIKKGGKFIGIDWYSTEYSEYKNGEQAEDINTRKNFTTGNFANTGRVHFSDETHLKEIFSNFVIEIMEHKTINRSIPNDGYNFASWNFIARKD